MVVDNVSLSLKQVLELNNTLLRTYKPLYFLQSIFHLSAREKKTLVHLWDRLPLTSLFVNKKSTTASLYYDSKAESDVQHSNLNISAACRG